MAVVSPTSENPIKVSKFTADAVLFDMDGTLTDSIAAVEAAWTAKAEELGLDPEEVIAATHGRRAEDNLLELVPNLKREDVHKAVDDFEKSILRFADTPPSRRSSISGSRRSSRSGSNAGSRSNSMSGGRRPSMGFGGGLAFALSKIPVVNDERFRKPVDMDEDALSEAITEDLVDMSVQILPGVRRLIGSLPKDRYAVATSGARTYCHGCLTRTKIEIPKVCVTADDPRLTRGKPFPDPFLLAAKDLNVDPKRCVIFEDSPSGIKAAVAAGSTVIAVCTSHQRHKIDKFGAHFVCDTMEQIKVTVLESGELEFEVKQ